MKLRARHLALIILLSIPVPGLADMWFDFPEGSPADWPVRSGPSYPIFESPWFPPSYAVAEGKSVDELYGGRKLNLKEIEKVRQGLSLLQFTETFNPLKIGPSDFYLESKNGALLIDPAKFKDITQTGIGVPANSVMLKLLDDSLSKYGAVPRIHNYYDTLVSAVYMNIETMNDQKVIVLKLDDAKQQKGDGIKIPEPFYFSRLEGMSWLVERGFISVRGSIKDVEAFKAFGGAQQAEEVLKLISGLKDSPKDWTEWADKNKKVAPKPVPNEATTVDDFAVGMVAHELSLARYYNYETKFADLTRTLPSIMLPGVLAALDNEVSLIRHNAVALLGDLGSDEAHKALIACLESKDAVVRHRALAAMVKQWKTDYEEPLVKCYANADNPLKARILQTLGYGSKKESLDLLKKESANEDLDIAYSAWRGLVKREDSAEAFMAGPAGKNTFMDPIPFIKLTGRAVHGEDKDRDAFIAEARSVLKRINAKASWQTWKKYMQDVKGPEALIEALSVMSRSETPYKKWVTLSRDIITPGNRKSLDAIHPSWRNSYLWSLGRWASKESIREHLPELKALIKRTMKKTDLPGDNSIFRDPSAQFRDSWLTDAEAKGAALILTHRVEPAEALKLAEDLLKKLQKKKKPTIGDLMSKSFCIRILARSPNKGTMKLFQSLIKDRKESLVNRMNAASGLATTDKPEKIIKDFLKIATDKKDDPLFRSCVVKFLGLLDKNGDHRDKFLPLLVDDVPAVRAVAGVLFRKLHQDKKFVNPYAGMDDHKSYRDYWAAKAGK